MELPKEIEMLYRHWGYHTHKHKQRQVEDLFEKSKLFEEISWFIRERISIWEKRYTNQDQPYTSDPILSTYRFCNILRELDRQTIEHHTLLNPLRGDFPRWLLNMFYCRLVARPQTVQQAGLLSFSQAENNLLYKRLIGSPRPRYGVPYVFPISVIQKSATPTRELFVTQYLPTVMKRFAQEIRIWEKVSIKEGAERILPLFGYNLHFLWTVLLIASAYQFPEHIDLYKPFPVGPGAAPTFKRINSQKEPSVLAARLSQLGYDSGLTYKGLPIILSAENWEGIGCEFRKYSNLKAGRGRKRRYKPLIAQ